MEPEPGLVTKVALRLGIADEDALRIMAQITAAAADPDPAPEMPFRVVVDVLAADVAQAAMLAGRLGTVVGTPVSLENGVSEAPKRG